MFDRSLNEPNFCDISHMPEDFYITILICCVRAKRCFFFIIIVNRTEPHILSSIASLSSFIFESIWQFFSFFHNVFKKVSLFNYQWNASKIILQCQTFVCRWHVCKSQENRKLGFCQLTNLKLHGYKKSVWKSQMGGCWGFLLSMVSFSHFIKGGGGCCLG